MLSQRLITREKAGDSEVMNIIGDVKNKTCILLDDIADSAGTLCNAAKALKINGAKEIFSYIAHGVLSGKALEKIKNSEIQELVLTDSIEASKEVKNSKNIRPIKIKTEPYPGFPTDLQAQIMVLMTRANGTSKIKENIFENRFMHVAELRRLGAKINIVKNKAIIDGNTQFVGAELMSSDLRASVSLVLAAMVSKGRSTINRIYHLDRGYENIENKLKKIGVRIKRLK